MKNKKPTKAQQEWDNDVPPHLSSKMLRGIQFLARSKDVEDAKTRADFLERNLHFSVKEIQFITLALAIPMIDKFFSSPDNLDLAKQFVSNIPTPTIH